MKQPVIKRSRKLGFNMTPMIDVVFLLIIFFLVSSHLARQESQLQLPLPVAESGDEDPMAAAPRLVINVRDDGKISLAGRDVSELEISSRLAQAKLDLGDDMEIRLRSSRDTPYGMIEPIMKACTDVGIWNVTYAVYREEN